jgi:hypothetical protein
MGNSKDYNEVIFAGKQVDEARCGMDEIKEKTREVQGPRTRIPHLPGPSFKWAWATLHRDRGKVARTSVALWRFLRNHWLDATKAPTMLVCHALHLHKPQRSLGAWT